jgi:hypothetical protein
MKGTAGGKGESGAASAARARWRVGRRVPRNVYRGDEPVAMVAGAPGDAERLARFIARACNEKEEGGDAP